MNSNSSMMNKLLLLAIGAVTGLQQPPAVDPELAVRSETAEDGMFVFPSMKMNVLSLVSKMAFLS